jgi:hypothetical protein
MAFSKVKAQANLGITQTTIYDVVNTSGVDIGGILITNTTPTNRQLFLSIVPTGQSMTSGNSIMWGIEIGGTGILNASIPLFLASGDKLTGSGSAVGLNVYSSILKLN